MGRNSTFKKRRHSYKGALALEIRVRGIVTNFVVYYRIELNLLHASQTCRNASHARRRGFDRILRKFLVLEYHGTGTKSTQILNLVLTRIA
jgi:hypothetical protein